MQSDIKNIVVGLLLGSGVTAIVITGLFFAGFLQLGPSRVPNSEIVAPSEQPTNSVFVPGIIPTPTFAATNTPAPVASPTTDASGGETLLADRIDQTLQTYGGDWNIIIRADGSHTAYSHNSDQIVHVASIIKVPVAMLFFKMLEEQGISPADYPTYLSTKGVGRTYQQLLKAMLVDSEESATGTLRTVITESKLDVKTTLESWGAIHTDLSKRHSTLDDIAKLYESLYFDRAISPEGRQIILDYMSAYTPNDDTRLGVLRPALPSGAKFYNKRGTITEGILVVGDAALFTWPQDGKEKVYVVVILSYPGDPPVSDVKLVHGLEAIAHQFWNFADPKRQ